MMCPKDTSKPNTLRGCSRQHSMQRFPHRPKRSSAGFSFSLRAKIGRAKERLFGHVDCALEMMDGQCLGCFHFNPSNPSPLSSIPSALDNAKAKPFFFCLAHSSQKSIADFYQAVSYFNKSNFFWNFRVH